MPTSAVCFNTPNLTGNKAGGTTHRPATRVICLDAAERLLLLHWRDPFDGALLWEPHGGGIEPGETPLMAARRELAEETGLDPAAVRDRSVPVERDVQLDPVLLRPAPDRTYGW
ncbi:NUDIX hydrolase [Streptomyces aurantiacus]|uniref:NUDIX hydrolase n=1 Tax=Streptomyces aurantiacus TaxID=47760 RepID=UPI00286FA6ED|nr:NUDIX hydrolase [Streptomyces aurantiacus]